MFCTFSVGHCVVCSPSNYDFEYTFGIFKLIAEILLKVALNPMNQ